MKRTTATQLQAPDVKLRNCATNILAFFLSCSGEVNTEVVLRVVGPCYITACTLSRHLKAKYGLSYALVGHEAVSVCRAEPILALSTKHLYTDMQIYCYSTFPKISDRNARRESVTCAAWLTFHSGNVFFSDHQGSPYLCQWGIREFIDHKWAFSEDDDARRVGGSGGMAVILRALLSILLFYSFK